jgi:parallel beta-helix repeat protein
MLCLILLGMSSPLFAKVVYVSPQGDDLRDGLSWATAKRTVTAALQTALPGDQIWVRYGVYQERITLKNGVALYGGFRGTESSLAQRPAFPRPQPDPYETVLDGGQGGSVVTSPTTANRAYRLDGFTIRNGKAEYGGGLYLTSSANLLTLANCTISGNSARYGGGLFCYNSSPTLSGCTLSGNSARDEGGGVYCASSSPTLSGCTLSGNYSASNGGGVSCYDNSSPTLSGCTLSGNSASNSGGGVYCASSSPTLSGCTLSGNNSAYDGGGVSCWYNSSPTLSGCTLSGNNSAYYGGGVSC